MNLTRFWALANFQSAVSLKNHVLCGGFNSNNVFLCHSCWIHHQFYFCFHLVSHYFIHANKQLWHVALLSQIFNMLFDWKKHVLCNSVSSDSVLLASTWQKFSTKLMLFFLGVSFHVFEHTNKWLDAQSSHNFSHAASLKNDFCKKSCFVLTDFSTNLAFGFTCPWRSSFFVHANKPMWCVPLTSWIFIMLFHWKTHVFSASVSSDSVLLTSPWQKSALSWWLFSLSLITCFFASSQTLGVDVLICPKKDIDMHFHWKIMFCVVGFAVTVHFWHHFDRSQHQSDVCFHLEQLAVSLGSSD